MRISKSSNLGKPGCRRKWMQPRLSPEHLWSSSHLVRNDCQHQNGRRWVKSHLASTPTLTHTSESFQPPPNKRLGISVNNIWVFSLIFNDNLKPDEWFLQSTITHTHTHTSKQPLSQIFEIIFPPNIFQIPFAFLFTSIKLRWKDI